MTIFLMGLISIKYNGTSNIVSKREGIQSIVFPSFLLHIPSLPFSLEVYNFPVFYFS